MRPDTSAASPTGPAGSAETAAEADRVDHIAEAERLERTAGLYPEDTEELLLQAAAHLELAGARDRASSLYDRMLATTDPGTAPPLDRPHLVKALKAANLWEYGHEAEARAVMAGVRAAAPGDPAPWVVVAEALEAHDELDAAHEVFSEAAARILAEDGAPPPATATVLADPAAQSVVVGRHRVRRMLGTGHDGWDALADALHTSSVPLDELHDPNRVWALGSDNPAELRAEIARLRAELGAYRAALSRPFPVAVLHWPAGELTELLAGYPELAEEYPSHAAHLAGVETALRELAASGTRNLGIVSATVPSYEAFAASEAADPADATLLPLYATILAARGLATAWPPAATAPCWCGSPRPYGECHGA
ncbi:SEC-C domain-containing protein [Streptomyces sp. NPDC058045]|uniref:SEC-C domain-containing protein n=1 Tax=Streptomyces sp. NPDC058045 TaxID=3346311 RepID=UPI0036E91722